MFISWMLIIPSFKKSLIVEQFQGNYLNAFSFSLEKYKLQRTITSTILVRNFSFTSFLVYAFCWSFAMALVCYTAVFRVVTQRSSPTRGGALHDDTKNRCVADYYGLGLKSSLFYSPLDHMTTESKQRRFIIARCGGTTYNPTFRMCCGGTMQVRSGIRPACCGTQAYDASFKICCGGTVQVRSGIRPACCGTQAYDASFRMCCGGIVKFRCWPVSSENRIVMIMMMMMVMMIKLKIEIKRIKIIIIVIIIT